MQDETKQQEALKADESVLEEVSPASEENTDEVTGEDLLEKTESETPTESEGEEVETESTETEETEGAPKDENRKTAKSRIRELVNEKKEAEAKAESLADQVKKLTAYKPNNEFLPEPQQQPEQTEITYEELMRRQDALVQIRLAQQENTHRVQQEALEAIKAYPELDPDSDSFDPELSESISQATLAKIQAEPTAPVRKFVDGLMRPYKRSLERQASDQRATLTKQVTQQAMRPTQVQEQEKPFNELSIDEMEKKLGVVYR